MCLIFFKERENNLLLIQVTAERTVMTTKKKKIRIQNSFSIWLCFIFFLISAHLSISICEGLSFYWNKIAIIVPTPSVTPMTRHVTIVTGKSLPHHTGHSHNVLIKSMHYCPEFVEGFHFWFDDCLTWKLQNVKRWARFEKVCKNYYYKIKQIHGNVISNGAQ